LSVHLKADLSMTIPMMFMIAALFHGSLAMRPLDDEAQIAGMGIQELPAAAVQVAANASKTQRTRGPGDDACIDQARFLNRDMIWGRDETDKENLTTLRISMTFESFLEAPRIMKSSMPSSRN